jgi:hypothetical protein
LSEEDGKIVGYARFVTKYRSWPVTSFSNAFSLIGCNPPLRLSLLYMMWIQDIGKAMHSVKEWWIDGIHKRGHSRKAMTSLAMLVS